MIETGMIVDTNTPDSIIAEAFRKCCGVNGLRDLVALAFPCDPSQNHPFSRLDVDLHTPRGLISALRVSGKEVRR